MIEQSVHRPRTIRHHRCDERFVEILEADFGIDLADLNAAFLAGVPAPQRQAIFLCEWATGVTRNADDAGRALRSWARRQGRGAYDRRLIDAPPVGE